MCDRKYVGRHVMCRLWILQAVCSHSSAHATVCLAKVLLPLRTSKVLLPLRTCKLLLPLKGLLPLLLPHAS
jgi:hypothetical protein